MSALQVGSNLTTKAEKELGISLPFAPFLDIFHMANNILQVTELPGILYAAWDKS